MGSQENRQGDKKRGRFVKNKETDIRIDITLKAKSDRHLNRHKDKAKEETDI